MALYRGYNHADEDDDFQEDYDREEYCFVCPPINKGDVITWYEHGHNGLEEWKRTATVLAVCPEDADSCPLVTSIPFSTLYQFSLVTRIKKKDANGDLVDVCNPTPCTLADVPLTKQGDKDAAIRTSMECSRNRMAQSMQFATSTTKARLDEEGLWDHSDIVQLPHVQNNFGAMDVTTREDRKFSTPTPHFTGGASGKGDRDSDGDSVGFSTSTDDDSLSVPAKEKEFNMLISKSTEQHNEQMRIFRQQIANLENTSAAPSVPCKNNETTPPPTSVTVGQSYQQLWRDEGLSSTSDDSTSEEDNDEHNVDDDVIEVGNTDSVQAHDNPTSNSIVNDAGHSLVNDVDATINPTLPLCNNDHAATIHSLPPLASPCRKRMKKDDVVMEDKHSYVVQKTTYSVLTPTPTEMQSLLDREMRILCGPWRGSLPFECYICQENDNIVEVIQSTTISHIDIIDFLGQCDFRKQGQYFKGLYFCPIKYPPALHGANFGASNTSFCSLRLDLERSGYDAGNPIHSNGGGLDLRKFRCIAGRSRVQSHDRTSAAYSDRSDTEWDDVPEESYGYRQTSMKHNDKSNRRNLGRKQCPRSKRRISGKDCCGFNFTVMCDEVGYFINLNRGSGCGEHTHHSRVTDRLAMPYPCRLLSDKDKDTLINLSRATASKGGPRNTAIIEWNKSVTKSTVEYLAKTMSSLPDDITSMLQAFRDLSDVMYTIMSDVAVSELADHGLSAECAAGNDLSTVAISTTKNDIGEVQVETASSIVGLEGFDEMALSARARRKINSSQCIFFSIAWIYLPTFRFFKLCPEVIWCDVTSHSNNKGYHLLTLSCRTSADKQMVFMYLWIPNEQRQSFRWVFQHAIPRLIPKWLTSRVQFIMKDGDPQQRNEILIAMFDTKVFPNAMEGQCGWHIINQGWNRHVMGEKSLCDNECIQRWKDIVSIIKAWMYSWMEAGYCETEEEYKVSKQLLMKYLKSATVKEAVRRNPYMIDSVIKFIKCHVVVYENLYVFYKRKRVRHFYTSTSSAHEGTNFGLKSNAAAMKPTMTMDTASQAIIVHAKVLGMTQEQQLYLDFHKSNKVWSDLPTSPFTTSFAEGLIVEVWRRRRMYVSTRVGERRFQVKYMNAKECNGAVDQNTEQEETTRNLSILPLFERIRDVTIERDGTMICSCCRFESTGIFCEHLVATARAIYISAGQHFVGFTHNDVAVRYRNDYMHLAYKNSTPQTLLECFHALAINDIKGPNLRIDVPVKEVMPIESLIFEGSALSRIKNYDTTHLQLDDMTVVLDAGMYHVYDHLHYDENNNHDDDGRGILEEMYENMFDSMNCGIISSRAHDQIFDVGISNAEIPGGAMAGQNSRSILRSLNDESFSLADRLGIDGRIKLEQMHRKFHAWASEAIALQERNGKVGMMSSGREEDDTGLKERKNVPITQDKYAGPNRCYNTKKYYRG